jgi:hypothetical protein
MVKLREDIPWLEKCIRQHFPGLTIWVNFCPTDGCHMLYFGKYEGPLARDFVAHRFPIELTHEGVETAIAKLSLVA